MELRHGPLEDPRVDDVDPVVTPFDALGVPPEVLDIITLEARGERLDVIGEEDVVIVVNERLVGVEHALRRLSILSAFVRLQCPVALAIEGLCQPAELGGQPSQSRPAPALY